MSTHHRVAERCYTAARWSLGVICSLLPLMSVSADAPLAAAQPGIAVDCARRAVCDPCAARQFE